MALEKAPWHKVNEHQRFKRRSHDEEVDYTITDYFKRKSDRAIALCKKRDTDDEVVIKLWIDNKPNRELFNMERFCLASWDILPPCLPHYRGSICDLEYETIGIIFDYYKNGNLTDYRKEILSNSQFSVEGSKFIAAELLLAIGFLHMRGIHHRDIKPDNIVVKADGHIVLIDFESAKVFGGRGQPKAKSRAGTILYASPEMLQLFDRVQMQAHDRVEMQAHKRDWLRWPRRAINAVATLFACFRPVSDVEIEQIEMSPRRISEKAEKMMDFWSFGCVLCFLLTGLPPFLLDPDDYRQQIEIKSEKIFFEKQRFQQPRECLEAVRPHSLEAADLIEQLLAPSLENRLGYAGDISAIQSHPFFESIDWTDDEQLLARIPPVESG